jgi:hypothetical protein
MNTKPIALSREEIKEIAAIEDIRQMWGAEDATETKALFDETVYAVKFTLSAYMIPGYVGDYFILAGGALGELVQLIRKNGVLVLL